METRTNVWFRLFAPLFACAAALTACNGGAPGADSDVNIHGDASADDNVMPPVDGVNPVDVATDNVITDSGSDAAPISYPDLPLTGDGSVYVPPSFTSGCYHNVPLRDWTSAEGTGQNSCNNSRGYPVCALTGPDAGESSVPLMPGEHDRYYTFSDGIFWLNWAHMDSEVHCWAPFAANDGTASCYALTRLCFMPGVDPRGASFSTMMSMAMTPPGPMFSQCTDARCTS